MNEFLEKLEIGEGKVKLSKEEIKSILAEHGKSIKVETEKVENKYKTDIDTYKTTIDELKQQIENSPKTDDLENLKTKIADFEKREADRIAKEETEKADKALTNNILSVFGDRKFSSEYAKNGLLTDIKNELNKEENKGKGIKDLFDELTKDRADIFANPNQVQDMPSMQDMDSGVSKEDFDKMTYKQRIELKENNPELFAKYNVN